MYSPNLVPSSGAWAPGNAKADTAFDGLTGTVAQDSSASTSQLTFTPSPAIPYSSSVEVYMYGSEASINGGAFQQVTAATWTPIASGSGTITEIKTQDTYGGSLGGIRVDGNILVDNLDNDIDYNDTPTSNYSTLLPIFRGPGTTAPLGYFDANLSFGATSSYSGASNFFLPKTGKYYCELSFNGPVSSSLAHGLGIATVGSFSPGDSLWSSAGTYNLLLDNTVSFYRNAAAVTYSGNSGTDGYSSTNSVLGMAIDCDNNEVYMAVNNQWFDASNVIQAVGPTGNMTATFTLPANEDYMVFTPQSGGSTTNYQLFNGGQRSFLYTPPTGYKALQTQNLAEPTIKDPSEHFRAIAAGPATSVGNNELGGNWSAYLSSSNGEHASYPYRQAFDNAGTQPNGPWTVFSSPLGESTATFAPDVPISFSTSIEVKCGQIDNTATWNGTTVNLTDNAGNSAWDTVYSGTGEISTTTPLVV